MKYLRNFHKRIHVVFYVLLVVFYVYSHLFNLTSGLTVDEPNWISRSQNFLMSLFRLSLKDTYQAPHPGVLTMIAGATGLVPMYVTNFLTRSELPVIWHVFFTRFGIFIFKSIFLILIYYVLTYRFKIKWWAIVALSLLIIEPYVIGLSRILHVDTFLSYPLLVAMLYAVLFAEQKKRSDLFFTSFFFALSFLTKTPAIFFIPFSGMVFFIGQKGTFINKLKSSLRSWVYCMVISGLLTFILWPALWVDPIYAVKGMFSVGSPGINKLHRLSEADTLFYLRTVIYFLSPIYLVGFGVSAFTAALCYVKKDNKTFKRYIYFFMFTLGFIVFMTIFTKKGERYIMPSFLAIALMTGYSISYFINSYKHSFLRHFIIGSGIILLVLYGYYSLSYHPYYLSYHTPWISLKSKERIGLGEGLDLAAQYLNEKQGAQKLVVSSWYDSSFYYYFKGITKDIQNYKTDKPDYVVTYRNMYGREKEHIATKILKDFKNKKAEKVFYINKLAYVWIYKVK